MSAPTSTSASTQPLPTIKHIYKILPSPPPSPLPSTLPLSDLDKTDGFIHLSTATQVPETAARFFASSTSLWLLKIRLDVFRPDREGGELGDGGRGEKRIVWEVSGDDGTFPHLYDGDLGREVVQEVLVFERGEGRGWKEVLGRLEA